MEGGTYARAQQAGFNAKQASFFSDLGADTRNEAVQQVLQRVENMILHRKLRYRFAAKLREWADRLSKNSA
jgi:hypothetical protein